MIKNTIVVLALLAIGTGCSFVDIKHQYDSNTDFLQFKTYIWMQSSNKSTKYKDNSLEFDAQYEDRIRAAIDVELTRKKLKKVSVPDADLVVAFHTVVKNLVQKDASYTWSYNDLGYSRPASIHVTEYHYRHGTLILDIIDAKTKNVVWTGTAAGFLDLYKSKDRQENRIKDVMYKLLKNFPPAD